MEEQIYQVGQETWARVLNLRVSRRAEQQADSGQTDEPLTGRVEISGGWQGTLLLSCAAPLARRAAAIVFACPADGLEESQLGDVLGELTNIIGGNVKALLPGPSQLSSPVVTGGAGADATPVDGRLLSRVDFDCEGTPFSVALYAR